LLIDLAGEQLLIVLQVADPYVNLGGVSRRTGRHGRALGLQLLPQAHHLGAAGGCLLLELQHQVLELADLGLQLVQRRGHTAVVVRGLWCLGRRAGHQQQRRHVNQR
jgi:hypothetical protein